MASKTAFLVVDLVNDFVIGKFRSKKSEEVAKKAAVFLGNVPAGSEIIFTLDTHVKNDPEFRVWGEHCLIGTEGCELYAALRDIPGYRIRKRHYDAFFQTDLDGYLRARNVKSIVIFGISSDICVLHTCAGAFFNKYDAIVLSDLCASIDEKRHSDAMEFISRNYGFKISTSTEYLKESN